jgi:hypothetical protein
MPGILTYKGPISGLQQASFQWHWGSDGRARTLAYCPAAVTANVHYGLGVSEYGQTANSLSGPGSQVLIGVAEKAASTGDFAWFFVAGEVEVTTASDAFGLGHAVIIHTDETIMSNDADWTQAGTDEFGATTVAEGSAVTSCTVYLAGNRATWS